MTADLFPDMTPSQVKRLAATANAVTSDPKKAIETASEFKHLIAQDLYDRYLREMDKAYGLPPSTDEEYAADAAKLGADIEAERELLKLDPLAQVIARGCDHATPSVYAYGDGSYHCRCMVCGRCGHHTGNTSQGHYWAFCKVTGTGRDFHFCCDNNCELETGHA